MMLSTGLVVLGVVSLLLALVLSLREGGFALRFNVAPLKNAGFGVMLALSGSLYLLAWLLQWEFASTFPYFAFTLLGFALLQVSNLSGFSQGVVLLASVACLNAAFGDSSAAIWPLLAFVFALALGKLTLTNDSGLSELENFLWPATFAVGQSWLLISTTGNTLLSFQGLLVLMLSVALVLRAAQLLPALTILKTPMKAMFVAITGGLATWLGVQSLLLKPDFLPWVGLFAGASLLGFLLNATVSPPGDEAAPDSLWRGAIQLALVGIAALVVSRLFGTLGWIVLAAGLLTQVKAKVAVWVAVLFFLCRAALQLFISQYNPNVTGINLTHPYASAALYAGLMGMLLLPGLLSRLKPAFSLQNASVGSPVLPWTLLVFGSIATAGLINYFLHAEAASSLLVALTVGGLGISLLGAFPLEGNRMEPLLLTFTMIHAAIASHSLIELGNEAEKAQRLTVLGITLVIFAAGYWLAQSRWSSRPVVKG